MKFVMIGEYFPKLKVAMTRTSAVALQLRYIAETPFHST
jgi:hypothetical protein